MPITVIPGRNFDGFAQGFSSTVQTMQSIERAKMQQQAFELQKIKAEAEIAQQQQLAPILFQQELLKAQQFKLSSSLLEEQIGTARESRGMNLRKLELANDSSEIANLQARQNLSTSKERDPLTIALTKGAIGAQEAQTGATVAQTGSTIDANNRANAGHSTQMQLLSQRFNAGELANANMGLQNEGLQEQNVQSRFNNLQQRRMAPLKENMMRQEFSMLENNVKRSQQEALRATELQKQTEMNTKMQRFQLDQTLAFGAIDKLKDLSPEDLQVIAESKSMDPMYVNAAKAKLANPSDPLRAMIGPAFDSMAPEMKGAVAAQAMNKMLGNNANMADVMNLRAMYGDNPEEMVAHLKLTGINPEVAQGLGKLMTDYYMSKAPKKSATAGPGGAISGAPVSSREPEISPVERTAADIKRFNTSVDMITADFEDTNIVDGKTVFGKTAEQMSGQADSGRDVDERYSPRGTMKVDILKEQIKQNNSLVDKATMPTRNHADRMEKEAALKKLQATTPNKAEREKLIQMETSASHDTKQALYFSLLRKTLLLSRNKKEVMEAASKNDLLYRLHKGDVAKLDELDALYHWSK